MTHPYLTDWRESQLAAWRNTDLNPDYTEPAQMTTRRYRLCSHCATSKHASNFNPGKKVCGACEHMIEKAIEAQKPNNRVQPARHRNATMTDLYVPPVWGR